ncbi:hypothetical protein Y032_0020g22 [Ancylostoma ceylanicum]|uniref:Uncharacterized protein n=1 Tax=Ancylostoma ceylanicum TaxID=53326 RepID=A0A016V306_9BILA|nr:hypothetical protein Y032_0020g22 [Ancylostoma ceylanicum]
MLAVTFIATPLRSGSPWQMHDVKGYLSAAVISAIVMVISFAICVKRRPKEGGDPTEMPRRDRVGANGSVVRNAPSGIKPVTAKEERTALPPSKNPKGEKTIPRSETSSVIAAIAMIACGRGDRGGNRGEMAIDTHRSHYRYCLYRLFILGTSSRSADEKER